MSLALSGVSAKALRADTKAQDALAAAVRQAAVAAGASSSLLRVEFQSASSSGSSGTAAVVRLKLEAARGSSTTAAARLVGEALSALQDAMLEVAIGGSSSSSSKSGGVRSPQLSVLQVAVGKAGAMHAVLSHANVRSLVAVMV